MKVYIAGPMEAFKNDGWNVVKFNEVRERLEKEGHEVITPFDVTELVMWKELGKSFDPWSEEEIDRGNWFSRRVFGVDVKVLLKQDAIALLPEFLEKTTLGLVEYLIAKIFDLKILDEFGKEREPFDEEEFLKALKAREVL